MKWTLGVRRIGLCRHRSERAMIGDREPGTDRNRNDHVARVCIHILRSARTCPRFESGDMLPHSNTSHGAVTQTFSRESTIGAIGPDGIFSGGTTSGTGPVETGGICGCSTRVAMSIAVKSIAPARR